MDLEKFLAVYQSPDQIPNIQKYVNDKKEFSELRPPPEEPQPRPGEFYKHQELIGRLMLFLDTLLMVHRAGTGKTCAMLRVSEYFKKNPGKFRRVFILTRGPILKQDFRRQLIENCTKDEYLTPEILSHSAHGRKTLLTRKIREWYKITTYLGFASWTLGKDQPPESISEERIHELFDNTIFFLDEVHLLRASKSPQATAFTGFEFDLDEGEGPSKKDLQRVYTLLWRIFHIAEGLKIIEATATPMVNTFKDIIPLMNLILPTNPDLQMDPRINYDDGNLIEVLTQTRPYFNGRVSFLREADANIQVVYQGERVPYVTEEGTRYTYSFVYSSQMTDVQTSVYAYWFAQEGAVDMQNLTKTGVYNTERQAANFVFPAYDASGRLDPTRAVGKVGFELFVQELRPHEYRLSPELYRQIQDPRGLRTLSTKFYTILSLVEQGVGELAFCFTDFVTGGGAILLGLCSEIWGYAPFSVSEVKFDPDGKPGERGFELRELKRYAVITGESTANYISTAIEVFNHPSNLHGKYIKFLIVSRLAREGMSFANVQQIHLLGADWHASGMYQAIRRAIRVGRHNDLLRELRAQYQAAGRDPRGAQIVVKVYQHAAIPAPGPTGESIPSVDVGMYIRAEEKDIQMALGNRALKMWAPDCPILQSRNIKPGAIDGTPECDYLPCYYPCADLPDSRPPAILDTTTYFPLYALSDGKRLHPTFDTLLAMYGQLNVAPTQEALNFFAQLYPFVTDETLIVAVWSYLHPELWSERREVMDKSIPITHPDAFGLLRYPQLIGEQLTLSPVHPTDRSLEPRALAGLLRPEARVKPNSSNYTQRLDVMGSKPLREVAFEMYADEQWAIINQLLNMNPVDQGYSYLFNQLLTEGKVKLIEQAIILSIYTPNPPPGASPLINQYRDSIFIFQKPVNKIEEVHHEITRKRVRKGRKLKREWNILTDPRLKKVTFQLNERGNLEESGILTVVHTLYTILYEQVAYAITSRIKRPDGKLRILDTSDYPEGALLPTSPPGSPGTPLSEIQFRDLQPAEYYVYNQLIRKQRGQTFNAFEGVELYGTVLQDRRFRIVDRSYERERGVSRNARSEKKGLICEHWEKIPLLGILFRLEILPPPSGVNLETYTPEYMIQQLIIRGFNPVQLGRINNIYFLRYLFAWGVLNRTAGRIKNLCQLIEQKLREMGRVIDIR